jgi:hypothetical protein
VYAQAGVRQGHAATEFSYDKDNARLAQSKWLRADWSAPEGDLLAVPDAGDPGSRTAPAAARRWDERELCSRGACDVDRALGCRKLVPYPDGTRTSPTHEFVVTFTPERSAFEVTTGRPPPLFPQFTALHA